MHPPSSRRACRRSRRACRVSFSSSSPRFYFDSSNRSDWCSWCSWPSSSAVEHMAFAANGIPFSQFASLIEALSKVKPRRVGQKRRSTDDDDGTSPHLKHVASWISHYKQLFPGGEGGGDGNDVRLPEGTVRIFLRLFFPEEGARRRYVLLCQTQLRAGRELITVTRRSFADSACRRRSCASI